MALANILSEMPDLLARTLDEHTPDSNGYCRECRDASGISAAWPCVTRRLAEEAEHLSGGRAASGPRRTQPDGPVQGRRRARDLESEWRPGDI